MRDPMLENKETAADVRESSTPRIPCISKPKVSFCKVCSQPVSPFLPSISRRFPALPSLALGCAVRPRWLGLCPPIGAGSTSREGATGISWPAIQTSFFASDRAGIFRDRPRHVSLAASSALCEAGDEAARQAFQGSSTGQRPAAPPSPSRQPRRPARPSAGGPFMGPVPVWPRDHQRQRAAAARRGDRRDSILAPVSFSELCGYRTAGRSSVDRAPPRLNRHTSGVSRSMSGDEYFGGP